MPKMKLKPEQAIELRAKYESELSVREIAREYGISEQYVCKLARVNKWQKGETKEIYNAAKLLHKNKVLAEFSKDKDRKKKVDCTIKAAEKAAMINVQEEFKVEEEKIKIKQKLYRIMNDNLDGLERALQRSSYTESKEEDIVFMGNKIEGAKKQSELRTEYKPIDRKHVTEALKIIAEIIGEIKNEGNTNNIQNNLHVANKEVVFVDQSQKAKIQDHINEVIEVN